MSEVNVHVFFVPAFGTPEHSMPNSNFQTVLLKDEINRGD
jgi:hypothetical protein